METNQRMLVEEKEKETSKKLINSNHRRNATGCPGVYKRKDGTFDAVITHPFKKKSIWLGTFNTAEKASNAYLLKKQAFMATHQSVKKPSIGLPGTQRLKSGRYSARIANPFSHKQVHLGTFDTIAEASEAYFSKKSELKSNPKAFMATHQSTKKPSKGLPGTQRLKSGRYSARIADPFSHKQVHLGTFDTVEEASEAYFSKKSEFEKLVKVNTGKEPINCVESFEESKGLKAKRNFPGTQRLKSGKYSARIADPFSHKQVHLGTFDTVEEASEAYFSEKSELEKLLKVNTGKEPIICAESSKDASSLMASLHAKKSSDMCIYTVTSHPKANRNLIGTQKLKSGRYSARIRDPFSRKQLHLATFDTAEEASEAYFSKKSEFEKLVKVNTGKEPIICVESSKKASSLVARVHGNKSSDGFYTVTSHPKAKRSLLGIRRQKNGWNAEVVRDLVRYKKVWLGTSDSKNCDQIEPQSPVGASSYLDNDQTLNVTSMGSKRTIDSHKPTHIVGVRKRKSWRNMSEIYNPISKKTLYLRIFDTAEEASQTFQSKKLEFPKVVKVNQKSSRQIHSSARAKQDGKVKLINVKQGQETVILEGFQLESASGASPLEIEVPISKSFNGGSEQRIESHEISHSSGVEMRKSGKCSSEILLGTLGTAEEALKAYHGKKPNFERSKKAEFQDDMPTGSSAGKNHKDQEDEDLLMGQWVQLPGNKEVIFSLKLGVPIIDNYGSLLGEFSSLDNLSIC